MKAKFYFLIASFAIFSVAVFSSCSKSNEALISDYKSLCEKVESAIKNGDMEKVASLAQEGQKLGEELDKRELTSEEQAQVLEITSNMTSAVAASMQNNLQGLSSDMEETEE